MSSSNTAYVTQDTSQAGAWATEAIEACNNTASSSRPDGIVLKPAPGLGAIAAQDPATILANYQPKSADTHNTTASGIAS
jgi:hypothetical protein